MRLSRNLSSISLDKSEKSLLATLLEIFSGGQVAVERSSIAQLSDREFERPCPRQGGSAATRLIRNSVSRSSACAVNQLGWRGSQTTLPLKRTRSEAKNVQTRCGSKARLGGSCNSYALATQRHHRTPSRTPTLSESGLARYESVEAATRELPHSILNPQREGT